MLEFYSGFPTTNCGVRTFFKLCEVYEDETKPISFDLSTTFAILEEENLRSILLHVVQVPNELTGDPWVRQR